MDEKETKTIEAEIRVLLDQVWDAARRVDADRTFAAVSAVLPLGAIDNGIFFPTREDIVSAFREGFTRSNGQDIEVTDTRIAVLAPNVAIAIALSHFINNFKDGTTFESDAAMTVICVKESDGWKAIHIHQSFPIPRQQ